MRSAFVTILASSIFLSGCSFNTVSTTTIKKNSTTTAPQMPIQEPIEVKKEEKELHAPNIYKSSAIGSVCEGKECFQSKYDITQTHCLDFPVTYRALRVKEEEK